MCAGRGGSSIGRDRRF